MGRQGLPREGTQALASRGWGCYRDQEASTGQRGPRLRMGSHGTAPLGPPWGSVRPVGPSWETAESRGRDGQACPPHLGPVSITGRKARGRQDITCADQAPASAQLRGGNALSHSYARSSLLEGRRRSPRHTVSRLRATCAGAGRLVPEAGVLNRAHPPGRPHLDTPLLPGSPSRERSLGLTPPSGCQGHSWRWVSPPGLGNLWAPGWF